MILKPSELSENTAKILAKLLPQYLDQVRTSVLSMFNTFVYCGEQTLDSPTSTCLDGWGPLKPSAISLLKEVKFQNKLWNSSAIVVSQYIWAHSFIDTQGYLHILFCHLAFWINL